MSQAHTTIFRGRRSGVLILVLLGLTVTITTLWFIGIDADKRYHSLLSVTISDRNSIPLSIKENSKGQYVTALETIPADFAELLIKKEDRFFYYHIGINPFSTARALYKYSIKNSAGGASTITQQLAKNLLGTEQDRTVVNKLKELVYSFSLELFHTKQQILVMYANTVYLGNQVQGFQTGSTAYFNKPLRDTTYSERMSLLATLSYPNARNPWEEDNSVFAEQIHRRIAPTETFIPPRATSRYSFQRDTFFELNTAQVTCTNSCTTTVDDALTTTIRTILDRHLTKEWSRGARNGAVVVIDPKTSELLAMVGSKDPTSKTNGNQINMALQPRPIGSTIKPFIYVKGFSDGLRPYTIVDDREYKYAIATGFPLYPKNFDGQYHGLVTLHHALSNSLNVPSVKVLEFIGLNNFYSFLSDKLKFTPLQSYDNYQYGIALGGLEMDLLTLTHYFSVFPRRGTLQPLAVRTDSTERYGLPPQSDIQTKQIVAGAEFTELVHAILSDRLSGVNQFGLESTLNIATKDYGLKTGTSRDFHDSWVIGYTGDFVVGVWVGNTENEPLKQVTGQSGAGAIWHDVMNLLLASPHNQNTTLPREYLTQFPINTSAEWGLVSDIVNDHRQLLSNDTLIQSPYNHDSYEFTAGMTIPLRGARELEWTANGIALGIGREISFRPTTSSAYEITGYDPQSKRREIIHITVVTP